MVETDSIIRRLAGEAGRPQPAESPLATSLLARSVMALALAVALVLLVFGSEIDLTTVLRSAAFHSKVAAMALLSCWAFALVVHCGKPGSKNVAEPILVSTALIFAIAIAADWGAYPFFGRAGVSVPICLAAIIAASMLPLLLILHAMKRAVVTDPAATGSAVGLLAGTLGAMAYALACKNDGALFVVTWYGIAIVIVSVVGRIAGARYLRW